jgi:transposase
VSDVERIRRETDVGRLREMATVLARENERLVAKVIELTKKLAVATGRDKVQLELELADLHKQLARAQTDERLPKNEGRGRGARSSADAGDEQTGHGPKPQPRLEQQERLWLLEETDRTCPGCGKVLDVWEGKTDDSEEIDVIERRFVLVRHRRQKYRCTCGHCETALGPRRWFRGGRYSAAFAIMVAIDKYLDHLPLERQCRAMARRALDVDSNTLFDQLWALAEILRPAYNRLAAFQRTRPYLHVDETTWPMLNGTKNWQIWDVVSDQAVLHVIRDGRDTAKARALLKDYRGIVMSDGYIVYEVIAKEMPSVVHCMCLVHARRKFVECQSSFPAETERILVLFGKLYEIESRATTIEHRRRLRDEESRPVVAELQRTLIEVACAPGDGLDRAIQYTSKRWSRLTRFLDDPVIPLDNNPAERGLRGPVVGRKNHYGSKSVRGTEVAAIFYSLLESAKLVGADPEAYLKACVDAHLAETELPLPHEFAGR